MQPDRTHPLQGKIWRRLVIGGIAPTVLLGFVAFLVEMHYLHLARDWRRLGECSLQTQVALGEARRGEKDFLLRDRHNPVFLIGGRSPNLERQRQAVATLASNLTVLRAHASAEQSDLLAAAHSQVEAYAADFEQAVVLVRAAGSHHEGAEGQLQEAAKGLWFGTLPDDAGRQLLLSLRTAETDYLSAPTGTNADRLAEALGQAEPWLTAFPGGTNALTAYRAAFEAHRHLWASIGFDPEEGLQGKFRERVHTLGPLLVSSSEGALRSADAAQRSAAFSTLALIAAALAGGGITMAYLGRRIVRPITILTAASRRIRQGDGATVRVETGDEFQELAEAFNAMTAQLMDSKRSLEVRVTERTQALQVAKDELQAANLRLEAALLDRREAARRAEHLAGEAAAANEAKSEFLATISHELRTPINGIMGFASLLRDTPLTDDQREYVETVNSCSDHLLGLVNQVLDVARVEQGKLELRIEDLDLVRLVREVGGLLGPQAQAKGLQLELPPAAGPVWVRGDVDRVRQVLLNLVHNAIKFTPAGRISLRWEPAATGADAKFAGCRIADTGVGIDPSELPKVFQKFVQADGSAARQHGGLGLGLAICKDLVEAMGGQIGAESSPGQGSAFWFVLPAAPNVHPPATMPAAANSPSPEPPRRALVGSADLVNSQMAIVILRRMGFETFRISSAPELGGWAGQALGLLVLDEALPNLTADVLSSLRAAPPILTLREAGRPKAQWASGAHASVTKPISPAEFKEVVAALVPR
jgi:signal transduction histidine kinase